MPISMLSQNIVVSGNIIDSLSYENISGANIIIPSENKSAISNDYGYFSIQSDKGDTVIIIFSKIGYREKKIKICTKQDTNIQIKLFRQDIAIEKVTVYAEKNRNNTGTNRISVNTLQKISSIGGESDIMKSFRMMPGVESAENKSSLMVRGGSDDQNLIILDDVPLYYVNHLGGFVSVFNTDALKSVSLIKSAFPAHFGNRLSSVMDIKMKEGNKKSFHKSFSISLISTKFTIEGPIEKNKSSFILSLRRFNLDLLSRPITYFVFDNIQMGYNFYDINLKLNKIINSKNHIYFSFYKGGDNLLYSYSDVDKSIEGEKDKLISLQKFYWGNTLFAFRYNHIFNSKLFSNTTLSFTQYKSNNLFNFTEKTNNKINQSNSISFLSGIDDIRLNADLQYFLSNNLKIRTGGNFICHFFTPSQNNFMSKDSIKIVKDTSFNTIKKIGFELNYYIENKFSLGKLSGNLGMRFSSFFIDKRIFYGVEPRLSFKYKVGVFGFLTASYSIMHQNIHMISYSLSAMPLTLWIPASKNIIPGKSEQITLGFSKMLHSFKLSMELYYKKSSHLTEIINPSSLFSANKNLVDNLALNGYARGYGFEFLLQKQVGKFNGWFAYTYSKAFRQFDEINRGKEYLFNYDRPNSISIVGVYNFSDKFSFSADWQYGTGFPYTSVNEKYRSAYHNVRVNIYSSKNNKRMQDFHKLDVSFRFTKKLKKNRIRIFSIDIYNVYNRKNASYYIIKRDNKTDLNKFYKVSLFPIIPSVSYSLKF